MTIQQAQGGDPEVVADFEARIAALTDEADRLAGGRTEALAEAGRLQRLAETYLQRGLRLRRTVARYEEHLQEEQAKPADVPDQPVDDSFVDDGFTGQTALFSRPRIAEPFPLVRSLQWSDPPHRRCNGCLGILRDATADEIAAVAAGRDAPDVRRECPDCRLAAAAERRTQPYPPITPPDAA